MPSAGIALSPSTPNCALLWQQLQDNLTATLAQIPASTMDAMASALHQAPAIFCVGLQHNHMLARSLRDPMVRDDLWQAFEVIRTPLAARTQDNPLQAIVVLDAQGRVFVASDPRRLIPGG